MSEIINYINIIISYIMDVFYNYITVIYVIRISFWVTFLILFYIIKWIINSKYKYIFLRTIYFIILCLYFILILIMSAAECNDEDWFNTVSDPINVPILKYIEYDMLNENYHWNYSYNITYCMADQNWEDHFPISRNVYTNLSVADRNIYTNLSFADRNEIFRVFTRSNIPEYRDWILNEEEMKEVFKEAASKHSWTTKVNTEVYNKRVVLNNDNFERLHKGVVSVKIANLDLNLKWRNLCYLYSISHHRNLPFEIHNIRSYTPQSFYDNLDSNSNNLNSYWRREYIKYQYSQNELYAYMRIIDSVVNRRI